jgi:DNA-binding NarL/FixJ family response regulator
MRTHSPPGRILIVDDDAFNREGVRLFLAQHNYAVWEADTVAAALEIAQREPLDAAIIDLILPEAAAGGRHRRRAAGVELARQLKADQPSLGIIFFSAYEDRGEEILSFIQEGWRGIVYKLKGSHPQSLLAAIQDARRGKISFDADVLFEPKTVVEALLARLTAVERLWLNQILPRIPLLTERERDIADRLAASHNVQGIADALNITPKTVENHISNIYQKLAISPLSAEHPQVRKSVILAKAFMIKELSDAAPS